MPYEEVESKGANNHFNCPIVTSYPETIKNNVEELRQYNINFMNPFLPLDNSKRIKKRLKEELKDFALLTSQIYKAVDHAYTALHAYKSDVQKR